MVFPLRKERLDRVLKRLLCDLEITRSFSIPGENVLLPLFVLHLRRGFSQPVLLKSFFRQLCYGVKAGSTMQNLPVNNKLCNVSA